MGDRTFLPRLATDRIRKALAVQPVVVLSGSRQTGKTTLVQDLAAAAGRPSFTLDNLAIRELAKARPEELVRRAPYLILDEVQREPRLMMAIKEAVDQQRPRVPGRFLVTGSANLLLMKSVSDSLAGRASYVTLWPLTRRERLGLATAGIWSRFFENPVEDWYDIAKSEKAPAEDWRTVASIGGYPVPAHELTTAEARAIWFSGYVETYLERDLQDLATIDRLADFQRLMRALCLRVGKLSNLTDVARDVSIPRQTLQRYLNLLETSFQLIRLEPYAVHRTRRLIKTPKLYWADTGLALFLSGNTDPDGHVFENLVLTDLLAWRDSQIPAPEILYWRTASNQEVDFVIEHHGKLLPIEVKTTSRPGHNDARDLEEFQHDYSRRVLGGLLLHTGEEIFWMSKGILAIPWWRVM